MTPDRCPDCRVLSGSVHHALCGFSPVLSPDGQLVRVRMSAAPCPHCGEFFPITHPSQRHHTQSKWCYREQRLQRIRANNKHRPSRAQIRRPKPSRIEHVQNPRGLAFAAVRTGFHWLRSMYPDDFEQCLSLACLQAGIADPNSPTVADIAELTRISRRTMYGLAQDMGLVRDPVTRKMRQVTVDLTPLLNQSQCNWHTEWATV